MFQRECGYIRAVKYSGKRKFDLAELKESLRVLRRCAKSSVLFSFSGDAYGQRIAIGDAKILARRSQILLSMSNAPRPMEFSYP